MEMEEVLITAVSNNPVLFDKSLYVYRDAIKKAAAWDKVASIVGIPGEFHLLTMCNYTDMIV